MNSQTKPPTLDYPAGNRLEQSQARRLEIALIVVTVGLAALLHVASPMKATVLNLFFLPVVLAGFFLGRYRAGVLALLSVVVATIVVVMDLSGFAHAVTPIMVGIAVTLWGATLGLTALLVGTLCDERDVKAREAHEAHVGVVEVLARYLQSANPQLQHRALRVAELCERVARRMRLSSKEIDDIRVAALLVDMENIEITARVIRKAVDELEDARTAEQRTFNGTELVQSLGASLRGAFPLLLAQSPAGAGLDGATVPFGAEIVRSVRTFVQLTDGGWEGTSLNPSGAIAEMRSEADAGHHPAVLHALADVIQQSDEGSPEEIPEAECVAAS